MDLDRRRLYDALSARDSRFDGVFFVGVTSTGVYCRPICPAKTPRQTNCRFFASPQEAEHAGFRPCLRCRPELAPGSAPVDDAQRIAQLIVERLEEGAFDEKAGLEDIADQFELSSRQIRRIIQKELGVPPIQLLLTRRLLLAKQLLTETALPVTDVAFASGFSSLRRFNDAFSGRYGMPPEASPPDGEGRCAGDDRERHVEPAAFISSAVRLGRDSRLSGGSLDQGRRARNGWLICPDGSAGRREGLDQGDALEKEMRADDGIHSQPDAGAAGAARTREGALRSQRQAGPDCKTSQKRQTARILREGQPGHARSRRLQRI